MKLSFTLPRALVQDASTAALLQTVVEHTGSEPEAASILRGLERLGADSSVVHYEMTPRTEQRRYAATSPVTWSVRAVRY